jgi:hypothetical protein
LREKRERERNIDLQLVRGPPPQRLRKTAAR